MKHTNRQTRLRTLTDLYKALDRRNVVTITYLKPGETEPTVRTIEPYDLRTTKSGRIEVRAMCRLRGEPRRFFVDRIISYSLHRIAFVLELPERATSEKSGIMARSVGAFIAYELERDAITAAYRFRVGLAA